MTENAENVVRQYLGDILGKRVSSAWLALNSFIVDVEWELGEKKELYFWFEPTWHIGCATGVVLGSRQAQVEDKDAHAQLGEIAAQLNGRKIEGAELDPITHDIQLRFSGGYWLRTFVSDPADEESWYVRDNGKKLVAGANTRNYFVRAVE
ncbi:MAG: hypothetical protein ACLPND_05455 [Candidatus Korobacteraceae bacterium]